MRENDKCEISVRCSSPRAQKTCSSALVIGPNVLAISSAPGKRSTSARPAITNWRACSREPRRVSVMSGAIEATHRLPRLRDERLVDGHAPGPILSRTVSSVGASGRVSGRTSGISCTRGRGSRVKRECMWESGWRGMQLSLSSTNL